MSTIHKKEEHSNMQPYYEDENCDVDEQLSSNIFSSACWR